MSSFNSGMGSVGGLPVYYGPAYHAVEGKGRRRLPVPRQVSEDMLLRQQERRQLSANHQDLVRNFSIVAWAVRQHLDYVSTFTFRAKTGDDGLDITIEEFIEEWSKAENCDPGGRHRLARLVRMWEMRRVLDGDVLKNHIGSGPCYGMVQTIEGDRIQDGPGIDFEKIGIADPDHIINGVYVNDFYRAKSYMVWKRQPNGGVLAFDQAVPATFADLFGYFDRYDQVRGVSPLSSAANSFRDVYENFDYALLKAKVSQMMAFAVYRDAAESLGMGGYEQASGGEAGEGGEAKQGYEIDFNRGPVIWDLDPGDRAEILESRTPATEFQNFTTLQSMVALKSLDIPFSFFDEAHTNYSGARLAGINYEKSAGVKREDNRDSLDRTTAWRLGLAVSDGTIKLPRGFELKRLRWEWAHTGQPWYDPTKEVGGAVAAVLAGFSSPQRECKKLGLDFFELVDERAEAEAYARSKGVALSTSNPNAVQMVLNAAPDKDDDKPGRNAGGKPDDEDAEQ